MSRGGKFKNPQNLKQLVQAHPMAASSALSHSVAQPMATGGLTKIRPMKLKNPHTPHMGGLLNPHAGPGRTDNMHIAVPHGSYILPADTVNSLGQGNTVAGGKILDKMLGPQNAPSPTGGSGPYGVADKGKMKFSSGGFVPIITAGGEYHILPEQVRKLGNGNMEHGHKVLDEFVKHIRSKTIKTLKEMPGPKK